MTATMFEEMDDLFGAPLHTNPLAAPLRRPCAVCAEPYERARDAAHHLCPLCGEDTAATRARCEEMIAILQARIDAHGVAWQAHQGALPDDVAERWARLCGTRDTARGAVQAYERGTMGGKVLPERAERLAAARERLAVVESRIAATKAAGGPLAALLDAEAAYDAELLRLQQESRRWHMALAEVEAAAGTLPL